MVATIEHQKVEVETVDDERALERLASEWNDLLDNSDQRVFFLRPFWLSLWWEILKPARARLNVIVCRDCTGRLIGLAPLYIHQRRTLGVPHVRNLMFLGTGVYAQTSEYLDIIARRGWESDVARAVWTRLLGQSNWDRLLLCEIPSESRVLAHLQNQLREAASTSACNRSHHIDTTVHWDEFVDSLSRSTRKHLKRQTRRFEEKYRCRFRRVQNDDELESALDALVFLHQARWRSKGQPGSFAISGFENLVRRAGRAALSEGRLRLWTLELDDKIAAVRLAVIDGGIVHAIQGGFDPAYTRDSLGSVMLGMCIKDCIDDPEVIAYDFMGGTDAYKDWWTSLGRQTVTLSYLRPGFRSSVYSRLSTAIHLARTALKRIVPLSIRKALYEKLVIWRHHRKF
ncbi:MAG TPA: GNAT family N-acetyltransferase [Blastocatellia bacterium]|nr:GNAT family N-acetyltransferase [Blastocatellia bacterium]